MKKDSNLDLRKNQDTFTLHGTCEEGQLKKDIVIFVLKQSLLETGKKTFDMVERSLYEKYRCELSDCFENPEYISDVLKYVYDGSYAKVVESIAQKLSGFEQETGIKEFLEKISR